MPIKVIMGSASDFDFAKRIRDEVIRKRAPYEVEFWVKSAHRNGSEIISFIDETETGNPTVYVTSAGLSDALTGSVAANTFYPVIACPKDAVHEGESKKYSSTKLPGGLHVSYHHSPEDAATEAINKLNEMKTLDEAEYQNQKERIISSRMKPKLDQQKVLDSVITFDIQMINKYLDEGTSFPFPRYQGKVRNVYSLGNNLLIEASDRISIYDVVLPTPVPFKGLILTKTSNWWSNQLKDIVPQDLIAEVDPNKNLVRKARRVDIEAVVRGYLYGSALDAYKLGKPVCGYRLKSGLRKGEKLENPIFTPATKVVSKPGEAAHDENITKAQAVDHVIKQLRISYGQAVELVDEIEETSLRCYERAVSIAEPRGIIYADTKFEFGLLEGAILAIDEKLTPDSSRIWDVKSYKEKFEKGEDQVSFDKQPVRDFGISIGWDKKPPGPELPPEIVKATTERYMNGYQMITGDRLELEKIKVRPIIV